jgi:hypothetical protein
MRSNPPIVVVEDDPWTRLIGVVLDPMTSQERSAAFADFMSPDEPDFAGWCDELRTRVGGLYPSAVRLVPSHAELRVNLPRACALSSNPSLWERKSLGARPNSRSFTLRNCRTIRSIAGMCRVAIGDASRELAA